LSASLIDVTTTVELEARLPFLKPSWYFGLLFNQGWVFARVLAREFTKISPYPLGSLAALSNLTDWNAIPERGVVSPRYLLMPQKQALIYQYFWGVTPPDVRIFKQFPPRTDIGIIIDRLNLAGDIGYLTGRDTPYFYPSPKTEQFTVYEMYATYQARNPVNQAVRNVLMNFEICKYTYEWVRDPTMVKDFIDDRRKVHKFVMGPPDEPTSAPQWLVTDYGKDVLAKAKELMR